MNPFSLKKSASTNMLPLMLVGSLGLGGGSLGHSLVQGSVTPQQLEQSVTRITDKIDQLERHLDKLEDKLGDLEDTLDDYRQHEHTGRIESNW